MTIALVDASIYENNVGNPTDGELLRDDLNIIIDEVNELRDITDDLEGGNVTYAGTKTLTGVWKFGNVGGLWTDVIAEYTAAAGVTIDSVRCKDGAVKPSIAGNPASPDNGELWFNSSDSKWYLRINSVSFPILDNNSVALPRGYKGGARPVYATSTTYTVANIVDKDVNHVENLIKTTSTPVDIATTGLNGIAQSAAFSSGQMLVSVTNGSPTVTKGSGSLDLTDIFVVGDVINIVDTGESRRLIAVSAGSATAESNFGASDASSTIKRGGRAPNTTYLEYSIMSDDKSTVGILLSTRNAAAGETVVDFPTNYGTYYCQRRFAPVLDAQATPVLFPFMVTGWPGAVDVSFYDFESSSTYRVLDAGSTTTAFSAGAGGAAVDNRAFVPKISRHVKYMYSCGGLAAGSYFLKPGDGQSSTGNNLATSNGSFGSQRSPVECQTDATQGTRYRVSSGSLALTLYVMGYKVTEV